MNTIKNSVHLLGHVGQDPEISLLEDGKKMAKFSMATNETYTNAQGEKVENTYWHRVVFWGRQAEVVEQHVVKGTRLIVRGKLITRKYEDEAGVKHYWSEISGNALHLL